MVKHPLEEHTKILQLRCRRLKLNSLHAGCVSVRCRILCSIASVKQVFGCFSAKLLVSLLNFPTCCVHPSTSPRVCCSVRGQLKRKEEDKAPKRFNELRVIRIDIIKHRSWTLDLSRAGEREEIEGEKSSNVNN
jgi:hypothetical protein